MRMAALHDQRYDIGLLRASFYVRAASILGSFGSTWRAFVRAASILGSQKNLRAEPSGSKKPFPANPETEWRGGRVVRDQLCSARRIFGRGKHARGLQIFGQIMLPARRAGEHKNPMLTAFLRAFFEPSMLATSLI